MKCDELTPIDLECNMGPDVNGVVQREPWKAYDIDEVDAAIAELKSENKMLKEHVANGDVSRITWIDEVTELKAENEKLKAKLESVQATAYADSVDAGMRERRLKRALYKACANWACAKMEYAQFDSSMFMCGCITDKEVSWESMMEKCLKKAEEYK